MAGEVEILEVLKKSGYNPNVLLKALQLEVSDNDAEIKENLSGITDLTNDLHTNYYDKVNIHDILHDEPTGYDRDLPLTMGKISFNSSNREFTIEPQDGQTEFYVWVKGIKFVYNTPQKTTIPEDSGKTFIYIDENGVLGNDHTFTHDLFTDRAITRFIFWNNEIQETIIFGDERHSITMDGFTHMYLHLTEGTRYQEGRTPDLTSGLGVLGRNGVSNSIILDEDIIMEIPYQYNLPILYRRGEYWRKTISDTLLQIPFGNGRPRYNYNNNGLWEQADIGNNKFTIMHILVTNDLEYPYMLLQGQNYYSKISEARISVEDEINNTILDGLPSPEFYFLVSFIIDENGVIVETESGETYIDFRGNKLTGSSRSPTDHANLSGLLTSGHPANVISFDNTGTITTSIEVQSVLMQLLDKSLGSVYLSAPITDTYTNVFTDFIISDSKIVKGTAITIDEVNSIATVNKDGIYKIFGTLNIETSNSKYIETVLYLNGVATGLSTFTTGRGAGNRVSSSSSGVMELSAGDVLKFKVRTEDASQIITIDNSSVTLEKTIY